MRGARAGSALQQRVSLSQSSTHFSLVCFHKTLSLSHSQPLSPLSLLYISISPEAKAEMGRLAPLSEEPIDGEDDRTNSSKKGRGLAWKNWIKTHLSLVFNKKSDLRILLSVMGCPLFPIPLHPKQSMINKVD